MLVYARVATGVQMKTMSRRIGALIGAVLLGAGTALAGAAPAQAGYGGGCRNWTSGSWQIGACISENGGYFYPDFYVNAMPSQGINCYIAFGIRYTINGSTTTYFFDTEPCTTGHHGP